MNKSVSVKIYHGYGHQHNLVLYGHVFKKKAKTKQIYSNNVWVNLLQLVKLFLLKPYPNAKIRLRFLDQHFTQQSGADGFFKFEWAATQTLTAGWHLAVVEVLGKKNQVVCTGEGQVFVPHSTQYAVISDVDDTIMISHASNFRKRFKQLLAKNPRTRVTFPLAAQHFQQLALAHTQKDQPNPFFYVSSSEWNLYDYLLEIFSFNNLPKGAFLLNTLKQLKDFVKTGKTGHEGKLLRVMRILDTFPNQKFIFFGDNAQLDPEIYSAIVEKYPQNILAVYIRNVNTKKAAATQLLLQKIAQKHVKTCLFKHSEEAIAHSKAIGLI